MVVWADVNGGFDHSRSDSSPTMRICIPSKTILRTQGATSAYSHHGMYGRLLFSGSLHRSCTSDGVHTSTVAHSAHGGGSMASDEEASTYT